MHVLVNVNVNVPERRRTESDSQSGEAYCYEVAIGFVHVQEHEAPPLSLPPKPPLPLITRGVPIRVRPNDNLLKLGL